MFTSMKLRLLAVLIIVGLIPGGYVLAHDWRPGDQGGVVNVSITCSTPTAIKNASGFIIAWEFDVSASNDHGRSMDITGSFGPGAGRKHVDGSFLPQFSYTAQVAQFDGHAGSFDTCNGGGMGGDDEPTPPPPQAGPPQGNFEAADCTAISGWAFDPKSPAASIEVHIYRDGPAGSGAFVQSVSANISRPDVNAAFGITGNHGFWAPIMESLKDGQNHSLYIYALAANGTGPNPVILGSPRTINCPPTSPPPPQPQCPSTVQAVVFLASATVKVDESTVAFAPNGWTAGTFESSNTAIATIGNAVSANSANVQGKSVGSVSITGKNWTAPNGATNCTLGPAVLSVTAKPVGIITTKPFTICPPDLYGITTVAVTANVYTEVLVENAGPTLDRDIFMKVQANIPSTQQTGKWVGSGTVFKLIAPFDGGLLDTASLTVNQDGCNQPPPPPPAPPAVPFAAVYNTTTAPAQYQPVACGRIKAVWRNLNNANLIGYRIYNETTGSVIEVRDKNATEHEFTPASPTTVYSYSVAAFGPSGESAHTNAGSVAATWPCGADLSGSNKHIISVGSVRFPNDQYSSAQPNLAKVLPVANGENIGFAINIANSGQAPLTTAIKVVDTLFNVTQPAKGWDAQIDCHEKCTLEFKSSGNVLTFNIRINGGQVLNNGEVWTITYMGKAQAPSGTTAKIFHFQNTADISSGPESWTVKTPLTIGQRDLAVPTVREVE